MNSFLYEIKLCLRRPVTIFWMFFFPIILCTMFTLVLDNAYDGNAFSQIPISIINDESYQMNLSFQQTIDALSTGDDSLFKVYLEDEDPQTLLKEEKRIAILRVDEDSKIHVQIAQNGILQTAVKSFADEYMQQSAMIEEFLSQGISIDEIQQLFSTTFNFIEENSTSQEKSLAYVEYFSALAMACLYSAYFGVNSVCDLQANLSEVAKRLQCSCQSKRMELFKHIIINNILCMLMNLIQFIVMVNILKIDFGVHIEMVILTTTLGSFVGNGYGIMLASITSLPKHRAISFVSASVLLMSFFAGMMVPTIKYFVHVSLPILERINPASLLTDAYLKLSMEGICSAFWENIFYLLGIGLLFYIIGIAVIERRQYESL